jgi:hypothetical protein
LVVTTNVGRRGDAKAAHRRAVEETIDQQAEFVVDLLGAALLAYIAGTNETTVRRWVRRENTPNDAHQQRIRNTSMIARLLLQGDANHTVRAWFIGMNPQLDDVSPAEALREERYRDVMSAARAFRDGA